MSIAQQQILFDNKTLLTCWILPMVLDSLGVNYYCTVLWVSARLPGFRADILEFTVLTRVLELPEN
jgi:hypothetical protein